MNEEQNYWTFMAMKRYGGSFVQSLAILASQADHINLQKIKNTWPEYISQYEAMGREIEKKERGEKL